MHHSFFKPQVLGLTHVILALVSQNRPIVWVRGWNLVWTLISVPCNRKGPAADLRGLRDDEPDQETM